MTLKIQIVRNKNYAATLFICVYLLANAINACIQGVFNLNDIQIQIFQYVLMAILLFFLIYALSCMPKRHLQIFFILEIIISFIYLYSYILGVSFSSLSNWWLTSVTTCIPLFCCAFAVDDIHFLYNQLLKFSWPILFVLIVDAFGSSSTSYDMHFSYSILLILLLHLNEFIINRKVIYLIFFFAELLLMLAYGSRGSVICLAVFFIFRVIINVRNIRRRILYLIIIILAAFIFFYLLNTYGNAIYNFLRLSGQASRTWQLLLRGDFLNYDAGRFELWGNVSQLIGEKPILGWGIRGAISQMGHPYPHNLFLDLMLTFGIPVGAFLSVMQVYSLKNVFSTPVGYGKDLILIFSCQAFISLLFSGTVFTNIYYYIMMGLLLNAKRFQKIDDIENIEYLTKNEDNTC